MLWPLIRSPLRRQFTYRDDIQSTETSLGDFLLPLTGSFTRGAGETSRRANEIRQEQTKPAEKH